MRIQKKQKGFSLFEMMAVVAIILILLGLTALTFSRSRPAVKVKNDAAQTVSFLRNMWDRTKASSEPLILNPDYENGRLSYTDPRMGVEKRARFSDDVRIIGILLNDRFYNQATHGPPPAEGDEDGEPVSEALYVSEGRGLTRIAVVFGIPEKESWSHITVAMLNLVTGKGNIQTLTSEELGDLAARAEEGMDET